MNRMNLRSVTFEDMLRRMVEARRNADVLAAHGDFVGDLGRAMDGMELVYAVWPENDRRKQQVADHALAIIKGIPRLQAHRIAGVELEAKVMNVMFESHRAACEACRLFGDDQQQAA